MTTDVGTALLGAEEGINPHGLIKSESVSHLGRRSMVVGAVGPRGSGKTLLLVLLSLIDMARGRQCNSNVKIKGAMRKQGGKVIDVESQDLTFVQLVTMAEELRNATVSIDEINMLFDAMSFQSTGSKLFNAFMQQIRKRGNALYYTTQNFRWVDNRIRFQTDLLVQCMDMYHTPYGKEAGLQRGEVISLITRDLSGWLTGKPYDKDENPQSFHSTMEGKPLWDYYDTEHVISPFEGMMQINLLKRKMNMDVSGFAGFHQASGDEQGSLLDYNTLDQSGATDEVSSQPEPITKKTFLDKMGQQAMKLRRREKDK